MRDWQGKRYWLVGASEGLGRALADVMSRAGIELILSARNEERLQSLAQDLPGKTSCLPVDVRDAKSVQAAVERVGEIDGLIYLAGTYWPFSAQDWNAEQAEVMADVNFTGAVRVIGAAMPGLLERGAGHIVLVGSLSGFRGLPGSIGYSSSKAGLMHLAESMHADLRGSGIMVQLANPGFVRTRLTAKNDFAMPFLMEPEDAAMRIFEHMNTDAFKRSFPLLFALFFRLSQFLPDWLYYRIFSPRG
ncbi:SDR family NAD(P)-dependent oxidoreductase [Alkalilacustris brevis]|uniref:SDR family NAD(P)-dependent oxidoreductase n=1 Tax=Alkalilacustris brevis TaxID=2026338 RepID=UPI000E0CFEA7|nr:SDR family NAD(P)-dependent oxidoreductase [Alkalilacustris brevis]